MALDRLKSVAQHVAGTGPPPHPFDPLSNAEIEKAVSIIRSAHGKLFYNAVTLREPPKQQMLKWLESPSSTPRPTRVADVVALAPGGAVFDGLVDLESGKITKWEKLEGVQPLVSTYMGQRSISLTKSDYHGRSPDRGTCLQKRPQSY
jgi:primary-amine oxidase